MTFPDPDHYYGEERCVIIGLSWANRVLVVSQVLLNQRMNANCASYSKVSLSLGFKNTTK
jgi:hypothetical protein